MAICAESTYISLFSGAGGLELALKLAMPGARCICYVERDVEAAEILAARIADKALDDAPIWSDVSTFDGKPWRGLVDGIAGGFPCQDLSVAGKREGIQRGNRSGLWYEYARIIREVQPRWVFIENVPELFTLRTGGIVIGALAGMGFVGHGGSLSAADVGANHRRKRCFVLAYRRGAGRQQVFGSTSGNEGADEGRVAYSRHIAPSSCTDVANGSIIGRGERRAEPAGQQGRQDALIGGAELAHADGQRRGEARELRCGADGLPDGSGADVEHARCNAMRRCSGCGEEACRGTCAEIAGSDAELGNSDDEGLEGRGLLSGGCANERIVRETGSGMVFAPGPASPIWNDVLVWDYGMRPALSQAEAESVVRKLADGMAHPLDGRIDQLRACGNGVVPLQGAAAFRELMRRMTTYTEREKQEAPDDPLHRGHARKLQPQVLQTQAG